VPYIEQRKQRRFYLVLYSIACRVHVVFTCSSICSFRGLAFSLDMIVLVMCQELDLG